jgi:hypothetical protein
MVSSPTGGPPFLLYKGGTGQIQVGDWFLELPLACLL